jgi:hypothetical protein
MITKGNLHANSRNLAAYLITGRDGEHAELIEVRGFAAEDISDGFEDIQNIAETQTKARKPFFHAYCRLAPGEELTREQWLEIADRIEHALGFNGQSRAVALHTKEGEGHHLHIGFSRIDTDTMTAIDPGLYKNKLKELSRQLEREYALKEITSSRAPEQKTLAAGEKEFEEARRKGVDIIATREAIRDCWDRSDNAESFAAALADKGMRIAKGDQRDYVVVVHEGGLHALGKRINGQSAADIRARLGEQFRATLPTVDEARQQIEAHRIAAREAARGEPRDIAQPPPPSKTHIDPDQIRAEVTELWQANETGRGFVDAVSQHGYILASGDRRPWVLVDSDAKIHALPRMIDGIKTGDVRAKMGDIILPTVEAAQAEMQGRAAHRSSAKQAAPIHDRDAYDRVWQEKVSDAAIAADRQSHEMVGAKLPPPRTLRSAPDVTPRSDPGWTNKARLASSLRVGRGLPRAASRIADGAARMAEGVIGFMDGLLGGSAQTDPNHAEQPRLASQHVPEAEPNVKPPRRELPVQEQQQQAPISEGAMRAKMNEPEPTIEVNPGLYLEIQRRKLPQ